MLTADAFGVLPPIARLSPEAAMYHFLSGYTAKVAGTEKGVTEPSATFSTCFGAPFLPLNPNVYAKMLGEQIATHNARVWLVNTGWTGGPHGVGSRMKIAYTRAMIRAALSGRARPGGLHPPPGVQRRRADHAAPACPTACSTRAAPGPTRRPTTPRRPSWPRCSSRTSRRSPAMSTPASSRPARAGERGRAGARGVRGRHRARDPRAAADRHQDLLRLSGALRRRAEHATSARCAWACPARCRC